MSDVNLGNVRFSATFNTSGLDAGMSAMRNTQKQAEALDKTLKNIKGPKKPDMGWANDINGLFHSLAASSTLTLGPLSGVAARVQALNAIMSASGIAGAALIGTLAGVALGFGVIASSAVKAAMEIQRVSLALKAVTGSALEAKVQLDFVREVSDKSGTSVADTARSWARFEAAGRAAGMSLAVLKKSFVETAMAAGTLSLSGDDVQGVFKALEQMLSKGVVQSEELRGQLGDRFPAAFAIAAKAVNKTTAELQAMLKKGQVISSEFVPAFTAAAAKFYNIDLTKPIDTLNASLGRSRNAWLFFSKAVDEAFGISGAFKTIIDDVTASLNYMAKHLEDVKRVMGGVLGAFAGFASATIAVMAMAAAWRALVAAGITLTSILAGMRTGVIALNVAMMATPLGWVGIFLRAAGALGGYFLGVKMADDITRKLNKAMIDTSGIDAFIAAQMKLRTATKEATDEMIRQQLVAMNIALEEQRKANEAVEKAKAASSPGGVAGMAAFITPDAQALMPGGMDMTKAAVAADAQDKLRNSTVKLKEANANLNKEVAKVNALMTIAKQPIHEVTEAMNKLAVKEKADDSTRAMKKLVEELRKGAYTIDILNQKANLLQKGFGPETREFLNVDNLDKAREALEKIEPKDMPKVIAELEKLGYTTGTAQERVVAFFADWDKGTKNFNDSKDLFESMNKATTKLTQSWIDAAKAKQDFDGKINALQTGGTAGVKAFEQAKQIQDALRDYRAALIERSAQPGSGLDPAKIDALIEQRRKLLQGNDLLATSFDRQAESVKNAEDAMMNWYNTSINALTDVIFEGKKLGDTIMDIGKALARMAIQILVLEPLERAFRSFVTGTDVHGQPKAGGTDWAAMAVQIGAKIFGFANGGRPPVGRASIVGENGPELFVPDGPGTVVPNSLLSSSSNPTIINITTNVDARGATQDAVAALRGELALRDARLRSELPFIIDNRTRDSRLRGRG